MNATRIPSGPSAGFDGAACSGESGPGTDPVVFVGAATLDAIALLDAFPEPDQRVVARQITYAGGGPAATAAVAAARLGLPAAFVGVVGDDEEGGRIVDGLRAEGVDTSGVRRAPGARSGASVVLVDRSRSTRAICTRPVPALDLPADSTSAHLVRSARWVHVDHLGWAPVHALLAGTTEPSGRPRLSVDAGNPIAGFTPQGVDLFVPTVEALVRIYGARPVADLLAAALADGARCVVATRGAAGSLARTADGESAEAPGYPVEVVSTLGAGDVFHGALLAAVVSGRPLAQALAYANVVAALSCRGVDGRSAIPTDAEAADALAAMTR